MSAAVPHLFAKHPRLWIGLVGGALAFALLPAEWSPISRVLVAWNIGSVLFLCLVYAWLAGLSPQAIRSRYVEEDESASFILMVVVIAAMLSVAAIVHPLASLKHEAGIVRAAHTALAAFTLVSSWTLVATMFTTHYADLFYSSADDERPLNFPNTPMPAFWDFAYFSLTIAAACQTSDVSIENTAMRKVVIVQTLVSFFFNVSIIGFAINVSAGSIGG